MIQFRFTLVILFFVYLMGKAIFPRSIISLVLAFTRRLRATNTLIYATAKAKPIMNNIEKIATRFSVGKKIILDWHDDIVSGMIQLENINQWWLVSLVAWGLNEKMKVYSLKKLSERDASHFLNLLKGQSPSWPIWNASPLLLSKFDELTEQIAEMINRRSSEHYLILTNDIDNGIHAIKAWTYSKKLSPPDVDEIVNMPVVEREYWYDFVV